MNKEIKEIKHIMICLKEHIALSDDEDNLLLDYITNLQQEINKLTAESTEWESKYYEMQDNFHTANDEIERLKRLADKDYTELNIVELKAFDYKSRCEKAIEYVKENLTLVSILDGKKFYGLNDYKFSYQDLLNILQGENNDN